MSNFQADIASSFLFNEYFQKKLPDLSTKFAKFVWEVPYSFLRMVNSIRIRQEYLGCVENFEMFR